MRPSFRPALLSFLLLGLATAVGAAEPQPKIILDLWDAAYLQGSRAGYVHTYVQEFATDDGKILRGAMELRLAVLRSGKAIQLGMDSGTFETIDGRVVGTFMKQFLGAAKTLEIAGIVHGGMLRLTLDTGKDLESAPWDPQVVGLARQLRLARERAIAPGKEFHYLSFEPSINLVVKTTVQAKGFEDVELFGGKLKQRLLRVESRAEKIQNVQLPTLVSWLGEDLMTVRSEADIPPFGRVTLYRTTKALALSPGTVARPTEISTNQYVKLARRIANPYETTTALYRITIRDEEDPASVFVRDERQQVKKVQGNTIEMRVSAAGLKKEVAAPPSEYAQSSYFITSDDVRVKALAQRAVTGDTDPWKKALRIERWVNLNMQVTSDEALAPADHVARTLRGDCTEFAMLTAAMCRAEGIPSRTAVGLIYADVRSGPVFAFHMWSEVWIRGSWIALDATLGKGRVGATHLKIADQSWHDIHDPGPLLPVYRVLGRLSIEVIRTELR